MTLYYMTSQSCHINTKILIYSTFRTFQIRLGILFFNMYDVSLKRKSVKNLSKF